MKLLRLEFYKCRRRRIAAVCAAVLAVELIWMGAFFTRQNAEDMQQGWMLLLYPFLLSALVYTVVFAFLALRYLRRRNAAAE